MGASACSRDDAAEPEPPALVSAPHIATREDPIDPVPIDDKVDPRKVRLGAQLFNDPILSSGGDVACTTCHDLQKGGADGRALSDLPGHPAAIVNTPTVFNVSLNYRYHWAGKFDDLSTQLETPITSPRVMSTTYQGIVDRLKKTPDYPKRFREIYPDGITADSFRDAMVAFEESLVTPNSRFDRYLRGDKTALSDDTGKVRSSMTRRPSSRKSKGRVV